MEHVINCYYIASYTITNSNRTAAMPPRTLNRTRQDLADFLRQKREKLSPQAVGLPSGTRRRTPD